MWRKSVFVLVSVLVIVSGDHSPKRLVVQEGQNVTLSCPASPEAARCEWIHKGETIFSEFKDGLCQRVIQNVSERNSGLHTCIPATEFSPLLGEEEEFMLEVVVEPVVQIVSLDDFKFQVGNKSEVTCETKYSDMVKSMTAEHCQEHNPDNCTSLIKVDKNPWTFKIDPIAGMTGSLRCSVQLEHQDFFLESSSTTDFKVFHDPVLKEQFGNHLVFCSNPVPDQIQIFNETSGNFSFLDFEKNDTCFSIMVTNETMDKINWSDIKMDHSDPDTLTMVFESRKLPDADIVIKILIPFTVVAIFTTVFFLILMAYRRKWWCFEDVPDKKKAKMAAVVRKRGLNVTNVNNNNNNSTNNNNNNRRGSASNTSSCSRLLSSPGCTPLSEEPPPYFYDKKAGADEHIYEDVDSAISQSASKASTPSSPPSLSIISQPSSSCSVLQHTDIYDTLDFTRPKQKLHTHYESTRTLKRLHTQEDYLHPRDSFA